jgi:16S rRNA processing protein RimM
LAIVGLIRNAQGIRGEVVIEPLTDAPDAVFASGRRVFVGDDPMTVASSRPFKGGVMVKFEEVGDRNAAELLRGKYLFSPFDELAPPREDEVYLHDLIGMKVKLDTGEPKGEVDSYYELPQGLTLEVKTSTGKVLVPYRPEVVDHVDREAREVVVRSEVGIFD